MPQYDVGDSFPIDPPSPPAPRRSPRKFNERLYEGRVRAQQRAHENLKREAAICIGVLLGGLLIFLFATGTIALPRSRRTRTRTSQWQNTTPTNSYYGRVTPSSGSPGVSYGQPHNPYQRMNGRRPNPYQSHQTRHSPYRPTRPGYPNYQARNNHRSRHTDTPGSYQRRSSYRSPGSSYRPSYSSPGRFGGGSSMGGGAMGGRSFGGGAFGGG